MGFFGFGSDLASENKDLKAINKQLRAENDKFEDRLQALRDDHAEYVHDRNRRDELDERARKEEREDELADINYDHKQELEAVQEECEEQVRDAQENADAEIESAQKSFDEETKRLKTRVAELESEVRELKIKNSEKGEDTKLAIRAATLNAREEAADEINTLEVKLAVANAAVSTAKAEGNAKDIVIKALDKLLGVSEDRTNHQFETLVEKLPDVELDKFIMNIEVPVTVAQKGGENNAQKQNK